MGNQVSELELGHIIRAKNHVVHVPHHTTVLEFPLHSDTTIQHVDNFPPLRCCEWPLGIGRPALTTNLLLLHHLDNIIDFDRLGRIPNWRMGLSLPMPKPVGHVPRNGLLGKLQMGRPRLGGEVMLHIWLCRSIGYQAEVPSNVHWG
jgi:hypothetical protein